MTKNDNLLPNKYPLTILNTPTPYKLCRICDSKGDLSKVWYVEYYIFDQQNQKLKRKRIVLNHQTAKERYSVGKYHAKNIDELLKKGSILFNDFPKKPEETQSISNNSKIIEACNFFLEFNKNILKPRTQESYSTDIKRFINFLKESNLQNITIEGFNEMFAMQFLDYLIIKQKLSNRSRNNVKGTMSTFFNFFKKRKLTHNNPFADIKKITQIATKHAAYSKNQIKIFKEECQNEPQLWLFINFIYFCFIRPRYELRLLKIGDIKEKTILTRAENNKNNATEHIMIPAALESLIQKYKLRTYDENFYVFSENGLPGKTALGRDYMYNKHRQILAKAELLNQNYDMYGWKHTGVIALWLATQNIELIRQQCRHADIATTQKYLRDLGLFIDYDQINKFPEL